MKRYYYGAFFLVALMALFQSCEKGALPDSVVISPLSPTGFAANSILDYEISGDGRFVVVTTSAQLVPADQDTLYDVYRLDRNDNTWLLISTNLVSNAFSASITDAGNQILFTASQSPVGNPATTPSAIYLYTNGTISVIQEGQQDPLIPFPSFTPFVAQKNVISPDGSTLGLSIDLNHIVAPTNNLAAFEVVSNGQPADFSTNGQIHSWVNVDILTPSQSPAVWLLDRTNNSNIPVTPATSYSDNPKLNGNGNLMVFVSELANLTGAEDNNGLADIFLFDRTVPRYTRLTSADANGPSNTPDISADGNVIAFQSGANSLGAVDNNLLPDIYVNIDGTLFNVTPDANGESAFPRLSADGRFLVFVSQATNLGGAIPVGGGNLFIAGPLR